MNVKKVALIYCEKPGVFGYVVKNVCQVTGFRDCHDAAKDAVSEGYEWLLVTEEKMLELVANKVGN